MKLVADTTDALGRRGRIFGWFKPKGQPSPQPIDPTEVIHEIDLGCRLLTKVFLAENARI